MKRFIARFLIAILRYIVDLSERAVPGAQINYQEY
jgi:hypothetical protein